MDWIAFGGLHPGDVDVEVADWAALEGLLARLRVIDLWRSADAVTLEGVAQGRARDLAIRYGDERYETAVMMYVIVILIVPVGSVPYAGDRLSRHFNRR